MVKSLLILLLLSATPDDIKSIEMRLSYRVGTASPFMQVPKMEMHHITGEPEAFWIKIPDEWDFDGTYHTPEGVRLIKLTPHKEIQFWVNAKTVHLYFECRYVSILSKPMAEQPEGIKVCYFCQKRRDREATE